MKKFALSAFVILMFSTYVARQKLFAHDEVAISPKDTQSNNIEIPTPTVLEIPTSVPTTPTSIPTTVPVKVTANGFRDGEFIGNISESFYGPVQVKAIISGGKITDVIFLQYPNDRRTSLEISRQAMPYLKSEAIVSQSANVDIVSGATQTSESFIISLASALSQAK